MSKECYLFSKVNFNVPIHYDGKVITLPPFAKNVRIKDVSKLAPVPHYIKKVYKTPSMVEK